MYTLSDEQVVFILNGIRRNGVEMEDLQLNLLDHICCIIEEQLEEGGDFGQFYSSVISSFYTSRLSEIEEETKALLNNKHYYTMKKLMFISGITSAVILSAGIVLKFMHSPGASFGIVVGMILFSLLFLPLMFTFKVKEKSQLKDKVLLASSSATGILFSLAILFKLMHWPGANMMAVIALFIMLLIYIPLYFVSGIKNRESKANTIVTSILLIAGCGLFLALARTPYSSRLQNIRDTNSFLRSEHIYMTEKKQVEKIQSESQSEAIVKVGNEVIKACDDLKAFILESETGFKTIDKNFEKNNALIGDGWVKIYFEDPKAGEKIVALSNLVSAYNLEAKTAGKELTLIPLESVFLSNGEEKVPAALIDLIQVQLMVLQNVRELKGS